MPEPAQLVACHAPSNARSERFIERQGNLAHDAPLGNPAGSIDNLASPIAKSDGSAAMNPPPDGLPTYRLLTGVYEDRLHSWVRMSHSIEHVP